MATDSDKQSRFSLRVPKKQMDRIAEILGAYEGQTQQGLITDAISAMIDIYDHERSGGKVVLRESNGDETIVSIFPSWIFDDD